MCSKFEQKGDNGATGVKIVGNWGKWWTLGTKNENGIQIW